MSDVFEIENAACRAEKPDAIHVSVKEHKGGSMMAKFWVPKSVVHDDSEVYGRGHTGTLIVAYWFAEKRGWT